MLIKNGKLYGYDYELYNNAISLPEAESWIFIYKLCRILGRFAFPIYALLIVEGFKKTSNLFKYFLRLLILAFVAEIPYDLMVFNKYVCYDVQNVIFTYLIAIILLLSIKLTFRAPEFVHYIFLCLACALSHVLKTDYNIYGILLIFVLYKFSYDLNLKCILALIITFVGSLEHFYGTAIFSVFFIYFYDGQRGILNFQKFSYLFFPLHMVLLYGIVYFSYLGNY